MIWVSCGKRCSFLIKIVLNGGIVLFSIEKNLVKPGTVLIETALSGDSLYKHFGQIYYKKREKQEMQHKTLNN